LRLPEKSEGREQVESFTNARFKIFGRQIHVSGGVKKFLGSNRNIDLKHLTLHENIEDLDLADEINNFFANVAAGLQPLQSRSEFNLNDDYISDYVISLEEVVRRLACVQVNKAPGPDGIPNWILRDMAPFISGPLRAIFNASVREGFVPPVWKQLGQHYSCTKS